MGLPTARRTQFCIPGLQSVYDLDLSANFVPLDGGGPLTVAALDEGEIDVAILFSTDGTIADKGWVVLNDDKGLINADNIVPVASQELVDAYGDDAAGARRRDQRRADHRGSSPNSTGASASNSRTPMRSPSTG